jgi:hypothetical protein
MKTLDSAQLSELLKEMARSDSVELKLTVPDSDIRSAVTSLDLDPLEAKIRQITFYDTPDLTLNASGVVVRSRGIQGGTGDTAVKLRPLPLDLVRGKGNEKMGIEVDAMPGGFVCSGTIKNPTTAAEVRKVVQGKAKIGSIFSKRQKAFFSEHAPDGLTMKDLSVLGPITIFKLKFNPKALRTPMVAELWMYPNGSRILELSTKSVPAEALQIAAETRVFLAENGIDLTAAQQTKTKTALNYFATQLKKLSEEAAPSAEPSASEDPVTEDASEEAPEPASE